MTISDDESFYTLENDSVLSFESTNSEPVEVIDPNREIIAECITMLT